MAEGAQGCPRGIQCHGDQKRIPADWIRQDFMEAWHLSWTLKAAFLFRGTGLIHKEMLSTPQGKASKMPHLGLNPGALYLPFGTEEERWGHFGPIFSVA